MAQIIGLPKLSPTMEEGVLVKWTKKEGDKVAPGDLIAEVETDKANMDFNIEDSGVLLKLLVAEGETVKLGAPVAILGKAGEDVSALVAQAKAGGGPASATPAPKPSPSPTAKPTPSPTPSPTASPSLKPTPTPSLKPSPTPSASPATGRLLASPLAKSIAIELGIDLRTITGTGPGGRIVERDVRGATGANGNGHVKAVAVDDTVEATPAAQELETTAIAVRHARQLIPDAEGEFTDLPASNMRKRIAARLTEAKRDVPHFYLMRTLDAAPLLAFRERLNALLGDRGKVPRPGEPSGQGVGSPRFAADRREVIDHPRVSVNDLLIKAVALALRRVPECNAAWESETTADGGGAGVRMFHRVHVGVAVALPEGLVTPVVRDADQKGIGSIAAEVRDLAARAKARQLKGPEITGSTFTVSNLGMMGIERFTAIINPPEAGILAIGATLDVPVVQNGQIVVGKRMTVTMSCDHRVIDGALGARWLQAFVELAEHPESLAL